MFDNPRLASVAELFLKQFVPEKDRERATRQLHMILDLAQVGGMREVAQILVARKSAKTHEGRQ